jgi:23S rRNA (uracil1939-C5)-methyltransferase
LKVGNQGKLGFYELSSNELVEIDHCLVAAEQLVLEPAKALVKNLGKACQEIDLVRKEKRQVLVAHLSTSIADRHLSAAKQLLNRTDMVAGVVLRSDRERHTLGDVTISVKLEEGLAIEVNADAFSQVNHEQNSSMVRMVMEWAEISEGQQILDLFCGAGNFSLPAARRGAAVIGVDADEIAVLDAQRNATRLGFNSARFIAMAGVETANFLRRADYRPQLLVLDPPRTGARELIPMILKLRPSAVIYVSCDLATVRRDMESLGAGGYRVDRVKAFDFFPNTHHVELVARAVLT